MKILFGFLIGAGLMIGTLTFAANGWVRLSDQQDWSISTNHYGKHGGIRFHDDEKGVTCWVGSNTYGSGGISCLPDSLLK